MPEVSLTGFKLGLFPGKCGKDCSKGSQHDVLQMLLAHNSHSLWLWWLRLMTVGFKQHLESSALPTPRLQPQNYNLGNSCLWRKEKPTNLFCWYTPISFHLFQRCCFPPDLHERVWPNQVQQLMLFLNACIPGLSSILPFSIHYFHLGFLPMESATSWKSLAPQMSKSIAGVPERM